MTTTNPTKAVRRKASTEALLKGIAPAWTA